MMWRRFFLACATIVRAASTFSAASSSPASSILYMDLQQHTWNGFTSEGPLYEMWSLKVEIGTPPQPLSLMMDTGSAAMVTYLTQCESAICQLTHGPLFNSFQSSTFRNASDPPTDFLYGAGDIHVQLGSDVISLAGKNQTLLTLPSFEFGGALNITSKPAVPNSLWDDLLPSGLLGMLGPGQLEAPGSHMAGRRGVSLSSPRRASRGSPMMLVPELKKAGLIPAGLLGFLFAREFAQPGYATLGGVDDTRFTGPIVWDTDGITLVNATVNGKSAPVRCSGGSDECPATTDSGAGVFSADIGMNWTIGTDCTGFDQLPTLGISLNGLRVEMTPEDYVFKSAAGCRSGLEQLSTIPGGGFSENIVPEATGIWQLAGRWMSVVYNIVDTDNGRFGWALGVHIPARDSR